jgi:phospholipase C
VIRSDGQYPFDHTSFIATLLQWKKIDKKNWNMGRRVDAAPTFEKVITELKPRTDAIIAIETQLKAKGASLNMGEEVYLKDRFGKYLTVSSCENYATVGEKNDVSSVRFFPMGGKITHGSFVLIQSNDPYIPKGYVLDCNSKIGDCYYDENSHSPSQWWTVKSVDHPYLGYEIKSGDKIYLESHVYLDPTTFVPGRLSSAFSLFLGQSVAIKGVNEEGANKCYWTIETK